MNNTSGAVNVYYYDTSTTYEQTETVAATSTARSTLAVGATYVIEDASGNCLNAVAINATTGTITIG